MLCVNTGSLLLYDFSFVMIKPSSSAFFLLLELSTADFFLKLWMIILIFEKSNLFVLLSSKLKLLHLFPYGKIAVLLCVAFWYKKRSNSFVFIMKFLVLSCLIKTPSLHENTRKHFIFISSFEFHQLNFFYAFLPKIA